MPKKEYSFERVLFFNNGQKCSQKFSVVFLNENLTPLDVRKEDFGVQDVTEDSTLFNSFSLTKTAKSVVVTLMILAKKFADQLMTIK